MGVKYINGNLAVDIPLGGSSCLLFPIPNGIWMLVFVEVARKTGGPREKPSMQGRGSTTNPTLM